MVLRRHRSADGSELVRQAGRLERGKSGRSAPLSDGTELEGYPGTTLNQAIDIFNGVGGFDIVSTKDYPDGIWMDDIQGWLAEGKPVMICWNDFGGHWQTIIGYDTMGTENTNDDVFLVADSYDTTDQNQDGYGVYSAERLLYNFSMYGYFPESEGGSDMLFLVASPLCRIIKFLILKNRSCLPAGAVFIAAIRRRVFPFRYVIAPVFSIVSTEIPYPLVGSLSSTWVTAPTSCPF